MDCTWTAWPLLHGHMEHGAVGASGGACMHVCGALPLDDTWTRRRSQERGGTADSASRGWRADSLRGREIYGRSEKGAMHAWRVGMAGRVCACGSSPVLFGPSRASCPPSVCVDVFFSFGLTFMTTMIDVLFNPLGSHPCHIQCDIRLYGVLYGTVQYSKGQ